MQQKYIFWDLDGTLVESESETFKREIFTYACKQKQLMLREETLKKYGHNTEQLFRELLKDNKIDKPNFDHEEWIEHGFDYIRMNMHDIVIHKNAVELWQECHKRNILCVVVTNNRRDIAEKYLEKIGLLSLCKELISSSEIVIAKPAPDLYLAAMQSFNLSSQQAIQQCLVIEDSRSGVQAAQAAGLPVIAWVDNVTDFKEKLTKAKIPLPLIYEQLSIETLLQSFSV